MAQNSTPAGAGPSVRYPVWLTEDARKPPDNRRSIEPPERIALLVEAIESGGSGIRLPIKVGVLFVLANHYVRTHKNGVRGFSYIEFKAVVRCMVQGSGNPYGIANRLVYTRNGQRAGGDASDEDEIVKQIREGMEEVHQGRS